MALDGDVPMRGTQLFADTIAQCWKRPSLTALEVLWRWAFGAPAAALLVYQADRVWRSTPVDVATLRQMSPTDPMGAAVTLAQTATLLLPPARRVAVWLVPLLLAGWVIASSFGRTAVLRRFDARLHARPGTLLVLLSARMAVLAGCIVLWLALVRAGVAVALDAPIAQGREPNLVLYCAIAIAATLVLFILWAAVSWVLSLAPLLAMLNNLGTVASLAASMRLGSLRSELIEVNLVMGIVKIALVVLAIVTSACPLPFESVATPQFMAWWNAGVTVLYLITSDFFRVARLMAYLNLWRSYNRDALHSRAI